MNFELAFSVFGYKIATINLTHLHTPEAQEPAKVLDILAKKISNGFFKRMIR